MSKLTNLIFKNTKIKQRYTRLHREAQNTFSVPLFLHSISPRIAIGIHQNYS